MTQHLYETLTSHMFQLHTHSKCDNRYVGTYTNTTTVLTWCAACYPRGHTKNCTNQ